MKTYRIVLAGNPNSGKTTVFNNLTGAHQHVGNWPGVTVERKEGYFIYNNCRIEVVDLPGTYSLSAYSPDEKVARDFLLKEKVDAVVAVIDASNIQRNLFLAVQMMELGQKVILDLNQMDMAEKKGIIIDSEALSQVLNVEVVATVANKGRGVEELKQSILKSVTSLEGNEFRVDYKELEEFIDELSGVVSAKTKYDSFKARWVAIKLLEKEEFADSELMAAAEQIRSRAREKIGYSADTYIVERRYAFIHGLYKECVVVRLDKTKRIDVSDKIDRIVTNKYVGIPLFLGIMWLTFQLVFYVGGPISDLLDQFMGLLGQWTGILLNSVSAPAWINSFIVDGIIGGVGSVLVFLPNIMILFYIIALLEDSGYMARAAFVMDKFMHMLGLHGKSFIPMIIGFGCNVPAIMAARTLENEKDRIITILVLPFMSCSARLTIYVLFASAFFPKYQGLIVFSLYLLGIVVAVISARIFKTLFFKHKAAPLIMELPAYHVPTLKTATIHMWERSSLFIKKAGTVIFAAVIIIWLLASLPIGVEYGSQASIIGKIGTFAAPILKPAGFGDWRASVALIFGVLAKEVVVGTLGTLYAASKGNLGQILTQHFTSLSAMSFLVMSLLYIPCVATIAVIKRETNWKWATFATLYTISIAWVLAVVVYQVGTLLGF